MRERVLAKVRRRRDVAAVVAGNTAPLLPDPMCSVIAEALKIDDSECKMIMLAVYDEVLRIKFAQYYTFKTLEAFSILRRISNKLNEVAEELREASSDLRKLLHLAYSSSGERGMKSGLQRPIDPLMPVDREWCMAHVEERSRGAPGRSNRNAVIRRMASAYHRVFSEAPTCTPTGRFMLLCQLTFDALGADTTGLESAVQRVLRELKPS